MKIVLVMYVCMYSYYCCDNKNILCFFGNHLINTKLNNNPPTHSYAVRFMVAIICLFSLMVFHDIAFQGCLNLHSHLSYHDHFLPGHCTVVHPHQMLNEEGVAT